MTVSPAYGRDYTSLKAAKADWAGGKDFVIEDFHHPDCGRYINNEDAGSTQIFVRYARKTKIGRLQ